MMVYTCQYQSPMGEILLAADEIGLTGLWFVGQKYFGCVFFRRRTEFYTASSSDRICIQTGSVADFAADPVWSDNDIWRDCRTTG